MDERLARWEGIRQRKKIQAALPELETVSEASLASTSQAVLPELCWYRKQPQHRHPTLLQHHLQVFQEDQTVRQAMLHPHHQPSQQE